MAFIIKQNDTRPVYIVVLQDNVDTTPSPIDLSSATSVRFKMRKHGLTSTPKVDAVMDILDTVNGKVQHVWAVGDTDTTGDFDVEFEIHWSDGGIETVPNDSYKTVTVIDDLDNP